MESRKKSLEEYIPEVDDAPEAKHMKSKSFFFVLPKCCLSTHVAKPNLDMFSQVFFDVFALRILAIVVYGGKNLSGLLILRMSHSARRHLSWLEFERLMTCGWGSCH